MGQEANNLLIYYEILNQFKFQEFSGELFL